MSYIVPAEFAAKMVDADKFAARFLDLLDLRDVKVAKALGPQGAQGMSQMAAAMQAGQGQPGIPAQPEVSEDTIETGALPAGVEVPIQSTLEGGAGHRAPSAVPVGAPNRSSIVGGLSTVRG